MLAKRYASAQDPDGVIDLERLRSGPPTSPHFSPGREARARRWRQRQGERESRRAGALGVRSVYRHGGLTLMEMPTPWLVPEPATCTAGDRAREAKSKTLPDGGTELRC